jgi:hypothetical protein
MKRKPLRKEMQKHQKKKGKYGINRKVLRNEIIKKTPKKKEKKLVQKKALEK